MDDEVINHEACVCRSTAHSAYEATELESLWRSTIAIAGMDERSGTILSIALAFIENSASMHLSQLGIFIFIRAFAEVRVSLHHHLHVRHLCVYQLGSCRGEALDTLFASLSELSNPRTKTRYCLLLERLVLSQHVSPVQQHHHHHHHRHGCFSSGSSLRVPSQDSTVARLRSFTSRRDCSKGTPYWVHGQRNIVFHAEHK